MCGENTHCRLDLQTTVASTDLAYVSGHSGSFASHVVDPHLSEGLDITVFEALAAFCSLVIP